MKLLLVTDHVFIQNNNAVFDMYCFDQTFFEDYKSVFSHIFVLSRMKNSDVIPRNAFRSDGPEITYLGIPAYRKLQWILLAKQLSRATIQKAVKEVDAVIVRVPSELGWLAGMCARYHGKPLMMEVIGDPYEAIRNSGQGLGFSLMAWREARRLQYLANHVDIANYVSDNLHALYRPSDGILHESVSDIHLPETAFSKHSQAFTNDMLLKLIYVGTLTPRKRCVDLIRAMQVLKQQMINNVQLNLVGDGPEREKLEKQVSELGLNSQIIFHGQVADRHKLHDLLDSANLFVFASASEGLPRAVIEAMARGLPVLATNIPGMNELINPPELFAVGNVEELARKIIELHAKPEYLSRLSQANWQVANRYSNANLSPRRRQLYQALANLSGHENIL